MALKPGISGIVGLQNQSSAEFVGGSLKFDSDSSQYLKSTSTFQNTKSYEMTFSFWLKRSAPTGTKETQYVFSSNVEGTIFFDNGNSDQLGFNLRGSTGSNFFTYTETKLRDYSSWYHIVVALNLGSGTQSERFKCYINGVQQTMSNTSYPSNAYHTGGTWYIGAYQGGPSHHPDYHLTNFYCISGQVLDPTYFGFTDPLTNTWKPKKYTGTFTFDNSFYLPMDGNSRIGKDMSGSENDWTPINFNGSVPLDSDIITGGRPILNTTQGGAQAGVGVFGSLENKFYTVSSSSGGGNPYIFDNEGTQPTFNFIRGATYRFDYTSATSHPLRFATAADAAGSSQYTTGTNTSVSNVITITVPHDAPDTLYYYCTNHSGMGNSISVTTDNTKADQYASNIVLAVPLVGGSYDFSGYLNCNTDSKVATNSNGPSYVTTLSNFYTGSGDFTGSSTQKRIDYATSGGAFGFGTDDFTIEWWMHATTNADGNHYVWDTTGQRSSLIRKSGGGMTFETYGSSNGIGEVTILSSGSYSLNKWAHWAVVRDGDTVYVYIDGVLKQKTTGFSGVNFGDVDGHIGGYNGGGAEYNPDVHLQDFRIYKGVAKYTGTSVDTQYFTVPSRSPNILPDTPSGVSGSSKLAKITDGAVSFDGTGDYLNLANSSDFVVGTGDFTMECYIYQKSQGSEATVFGLKHTGGSGWTGYKFYINTSGGFIFYAEDAGSGGWDISLSAGNGTVSLNRWHHLSATRNGNTFRVFVDGVEKASTTSSVDLNDAGDGFYISQNGGDQQYFNGFISNVRVIKGTALYTSSFTPPTRALTNVTNTKLLCCQSNTSATTAAVTPGSITANGDAAANNFNPFITDVDVVRGQETGYCTWNPNDNISVELSDGNLRCTDNAGNYDTVFGTHTSVDGKHYFEVTVTALTTTMAVGVYVGNNRNGIDATNYPYDANSYMTHKNGLVYHDGSTYSYQSAYGAGDTVGVAIDSENRKAWVSVNGKFASGDDPATGTGGMQSISGVGAMPEGELYPVIMIRSVTTEANFGQKPFKFPPPDGFQPLNTANTRPAKVIARPDQYVGVTTYRGDNSSGRVFHLGMSPDFVWVKRRDGTYDNMLFDTVRGDGKEIYSERNYAQGSPATSKLDFIVNGFNLPSTGVNVNNNSYVAWFWKAGGKKNTFNIDGVGYSSASDAGLDGGTITPSGASVGTKQGFSIIKWQGVDNASPSTISHGLTNQTPRFIIVKNLTDAENWAVYHASIGPTKYVRLNGNSSYDTSSAYWNNTAPTTTLITLNNSAEVQRVNRDYILYAWADVPGLQKFGSYRCNGDGSGGGNENGPFVELGFRPALILFRGDYTSDWAWIDEERCKVNYNDVALRANYQYGEIGNSRGGDGSSSQPENYAVDLLSNGFKIRASGGSLNSGTNTVTYAAWAKSPFSGLYGGDANAR